MNKTLAQTKRHLDTLFCNRLNEAVASIGGESNNDPINFAGFFVSENGDSYCRLNNGSDLLIQYDVAPELAEGTIKVYVNLDHAEYGFHALHLLMDVEMLEAYKDYLTQYIDGVITNEHHRVLDLSSQNGCENESH